ncbi:MAG TPA: SH3 domain-containing protein [Anaerolineales bacterium]|nr:SH3 domain-containing protein [Anaerolineales bacterium]
MKLFKVIEDYKSPYPEPNVFQAGEKVQVGEKFEDDPEWQDWFWCEGENQQKAWVPKLYLQMDGHVGVFIQDYNALELTLQVGEILTGFEEVNGFCMAENENGQKGWAPLKNLEVME